MAAGEEVFSFSTWLLCCPTAPTAVPVIAAPRKQLASKERVGRIVANCEGNLVVLEIANGDLGADFKAEFLHTEVREDGRDRLPIIGCGN